MQMEEEELDFDDPSFLINLEDKNNKNQQELSYAQKRQRTISKGLEKGKINYNKSTRKQLELELREEGLKTNLISKDLEDGNTSKALKIMKSMGFKPGEALGVKQNINPIASNSASTSYGSGIGIGGGGIGSRKRSLSPPATSTASFTSSSSSTSSSTSSSQIPIISKARTEPISFALREGRKGLGPSLPKPFSLASTLTSTTATSNPQEDLISYKQRINSELEVKKIMKSLKKVARMCEELDRRASTPETEGKKEVEVNCMWLAELPSFTSEVGNGKGKGKSRRGEYMIEELSDEGEGENSKGELAYSKGFSNEVVDDDQEELERETRKKRKEEEREGESEKREEEKEWFSFDPKTRLNLTLAYLRKTYNYCLWCGCQFNDQIDLKDNCPGLEENDH